MKFHNIDLPEERIAAFCRRWKIVELALFGSVLRDDFRPGSDEYQLTYKRLLSLVKGKNNCRLIPMTWFILNVWAHAWIARQWFEATKL